MVSLNVVTIFRAFMVSRAKLEYLDGFQVGSEGIKSYSGQFDPGIVHDIRLSRSMKAEESNWFDNGKMAAFSSISRDKPTKVSAFPFSLSSEVAIQIPSSVSEDLPILPA